MTEILKKQENRRRLARPLTSEHHNIEFGSKTGTISGVCNDCGFFRSSDQAVIVSVLQQNVSDVNAGDAALKDAGLLG